MCVDGVLTKILQKTRPIDPRTVQVAGIPWLSVPRRKRSPAMRRTAFVMRSLFARQPVRGFLWLSEASSRFSLSCTIDQCAAIERFALRFFCACCFSLTALALLLGSELIARARAKYLLIDC